MSIFQRKKAEGLSDVDLEKRAREAWKASPRFQESQQQIMEERVKKLGDRAFAHRQSRECGIEDDDKFPDDVEGWVDE